MPNLQNAKKALRQSQKRAVQNKIVKDAYKTAVKAVKKAVVKGEADIAPLLQEAQKRLDKASKRGVLKQNAAARKLSRLSKFAKQAVTK